MKFIRGLFKNRRGFSLIELMIAMGIGMAVLAGVTTTFISQSKFYNAQEQVNEMEQSARGALDVITRELKMAGYKPNGSLLSGLSANGTNLDNSQLIIEADLDSNGSINVLTNPSERIIYTYDSSNKQIKRKAGAGTAYVMADNITAFNFTYLNANGATASSASEIRQIKVDITAKTAKADPNYTTNGGYRTTTVTATITPPNLGY